MQASLSLDGQSLTLDQLHALSTGTLSIHLSELTKAQIAKGAQKVADVVASGVPTYGVNTGFGRFSNVSVEQEDLKKLQHNIIMSHATGDGPALPLEQARSLMALRINTLCKGHSGITVHTLQKLVDAFNADCIPFIPQKGTVGASGDLIPLSHIALGLIGQGFVYNPSTQDYEPAADVLKAHGLSPASLTYKEGLALINGTQYIAGIGSLALIRAHNLMLAAPVIGAMRFVALLGHRACFSDLVSQVRPHRGQALIAKALFELTEGHESHKEDVQDAYSERCMPQVLGPSLDFLRVCTQLMGEEINSATDNPLVFEDAIISAGNFHGEYPAKVMDVAGLMIHEIGSLSTEGLKRLNNADKSLGLPTFLIEDGGMNSGFMMFENLASAVNSENKVLCHPASADSQSTGADKENHVSMGGYSAVKAHAIADNVETILAVECMLSVQALRMRQAQDEAFIIPERLHGVMADMESRFAPLHHDRYLKPEYDTIKAYLASGQLVDRVSSPALNAIADYMTYRQPQHVPAVDIETTIPHVPS